MVRQALALGMSALLALPLWAGPESLGIISSSNGATVSGTASATGSSVFNGDVIAVPDKGNASVTFQGGSRAIFSPASETRVMRDGSAFTLEVNRGGVAFTSSSKSLVEGELADVRLRPANPGATSVGYLMFKGSNHALVYADKGEWLVSTGHDGKTLLLHPGQQIEGMISAAPDQQSGNGNDQDQNNKKKKKKMGVFWIGTALVGTVTGMALAFGQSECTTPNTATNGGCSTNGVTPQNAVSPFVP